MVGADRADHDGVEHGRQEQKRQSERGVAQRHLLFNKQHSAPVGGDHIKGFHDPVQRLTRHSLEAVMEKTSSNKIAYVHTRRETKSSIFGGHGF